METYGNIENILNGLKDDTKAEIKKIMDEAEEYKNNRLKVARRNAEIHKRRILKEAEKKAEYIKKRVLANIELDIKRMNLLKESKIVEDVFENLRTRIKLFRDSEKYRDFIYSLIEEGMRKIGEKRIKVILDDGDRNILENNFIKIIIKKINENGYAINEDDVLFRRNISGGVIIEAKDKPIIYNNTIGSRLKRMHDMMLNIIYNDIFNKGSSNE